MSSPTLPNPTARSSAPIFIGGLIMLLLFTGLTWWMLKSRPEPLNEEAIRSAQRIEILQKVNEQAEKDLNQFAWVDEAKGIAQVPVDYAMKLEIEALRQAPGPRPAYPVDPIAAAAFLEAQKANREAAASPAAEVPAEPPAQTSEPSPAETPADSAAPDSNQPPAP